MRTKAAVAGAKGEPLTITELELDEPRADEVRVRMVASGVCHTDAIVRDQWYPTPLPAVLGHEGAGVVEAIGSAVTSVKPGDQVLLSFDHCGRCDHCTSGHPAYCHEQFPRFFGGRRPDGSTAFTDDAGTVVSSHFFGQSSFAAYSNVAERSLVKVPDDAPLELLAPLGCGIQTGAGSVLNVLKPPAGSSIAIFGAGAVGCSALLAAVIAGCSTIIAVDVVPDRLTFARELGATHVVNSAEVDAVEQVARITGGAGAQYAIDTTGVPAVFRHLTDCLATRGHGVLVGAAALGTTAELDIGGRLPSGITVSMVIEGEAVPQVFLPRLVKLFEEGRFPFDRLIEHYAIDDINDAFEDSATGRTLKPVVVF